MHSLRILEKTGKDGDLSLRIPLGQPEVEYEIVIVLQPRPDKSDNGCKDWPSGYFEKTFGSINDETFFRHPQGDLPAPIEMD